MNRFDAIIIGFGKGGKTLAMEMAGRGWTVAVVERSPEMYGGSCINVACIPSKTLIRQAENVTIRHPDSFREKSAAYGQAITFKTELVEKLRRENFHKLADNPNITVYTGTAGFLSADTVSVTAAGKETARLSAEHIIVDTGSRPVTPPIGGLKDNPFVFDSESIMALDTLPRRLVIVGGGYIGLEFASMYAAFGSSVTVLESAPRLLGREDEDIARAVRGILEKQGVTFLTETRVEAVIGDGDEARVVCLTAGKECQLEGDAVLIATGRAPYTGDLNPEAAGIRLDERGAIIVDEHLRTSNPKIFAVGDVKGGPQFTFISLDDYRIVREALFGDGNHTRNGQKCALYAMFTAPPLAHAGLHEHEARETGRDIRVNTLAVSAIPRAEAIGATEGLLKAVIDKNTNEVLGCTLLCAEAQEIIGIVAMAIKSGLPATYLRDFIFPHPTMAESFNELFK